jgi:mRNA-degrading endonuclease RelE of RelBE toxin-antitoxin system
MNINVRYTQTFERQLKKYQKKFLSIETDLKSFISDLEKLHKINFEREFYKYRLAVKSKSTGKSGGIRIVTFEIVVSENLKNAIFSSHLEVEFPMTNQFHPINYIQSQSITNNYKQYLSFSNKLSSAIFAQNQLLWHFQHSGI